MTHDDDDAPAKGDTSYGASAEVTPDDVLSALGASGDDRPSPSLGLEWIHSVALCGPPPWLVGWAWGGTLTKPLAPAMFAREMARYRRQKWLSPSRRTHSAAEYAASCEAFEAEAGAPLLAIQADAQARWYAAHPEDLPAPKPEPYIDRSANFRFTVRVVGHEPSPDRGIVLAKTPENVGKHPPGARFVRC